MKTLAAVIIAVVMLIVGLDVLVRNTYFVVHTSIEVWLLTIIALPVIVFLVVLWLLTRKV